MKLVVFGLSVSSAWGNGHATLWRGLIDALTRRGHHVTFFERDVPYYAAHRDLESLAPSKLVLYPSWEEVRAFAAETVARSDAAIVTSFCPDGAAASELVLARGTGRRIFYDLDAPVTLEHLKGGQDVPYLPKGGLGEFDLVLSFTGGRALDALRVVLGARDVAPLYGCVDPRVHRPVAPDARWGADLSYLGTYSLDRQERLERLLFGPARLRPKLRFVVAGSLYPGDISWPQNVVKVDHVPPDAHASFYRSSPLTLSVTRAPMAAMGWCPSARLFEAAACGVPVLSDPWEGLETFFELGREILVARTSDDALAALELPRDELTRIGQRARERALVDHSADRRADELVALVGGV
ncbi:glycosyltransferase [Myxococcota bacterium]|nr:glycosyltransferase [Myxococcota bacterium]